MLVKRILFKKASNSKVLSFILDISHCSLKEAHEPKNNPNKSFKVLCKYFQDPVSILIILQHTIKQITYIFLMICQKIQHIQFSSVFAKIEKKKNKKSFQFSFRYHRLIFRVDLIFNIVCYCYLFLPIQTPYFILTHHKIWLELAHNYYLSSHHTQFDLLPRSRMKGFTFINSLSSCEFCWIFMLLKIKTFYVSMSHIIINDH